MSYFRATNPAALWLSQRFATSLATITGKVIVVRFDMLSTGENGYRFDAEKVVEICGDNILVDKELNYGEYLNVAATIADILNQKVDEVAKQVVYHAQKANDVVSSLDAQHYALARHDLTLLCQSLISFPSLDEVNKIWGPWTTKVAKFLNQQNML